MELSKKASLEQKAQHWRHHYHFRGKMKLSLCLLKNNSHSPLTSFLLHDFKYFHGRFGEIRSRLLHHTVFYETHFHWMCLNIWWRTSRQRNMPMWSFLYRSRGCSKLVFSRFQRQQQSSFWHISYFLRKWSAQTDRLLWVCIYTVCCLNSHTLSPPQPIVS